MSFVARGVMPVPRQGRRERSYLQGTGATEDAASGRAARSGRHKRYFAERSYWWRRRVRRWKRRLVTTPESQPRSAAAMMIQISDA